jgi:hypothetical protein
MTGTQVGADLVRVCGVGMIQTPSLARLNALAASGAYHLTCIDYGLHAGA